MLPPIIDSIICLDKPKNLGVYGINTFSTIYFGSIALEFSFTAASHTVKKVWIDRKY